MVFLLYNLLKYSKLIIFGENKDPKKMQVSFPSNVNLKLKEKLKLIQTDITNVKITRASCSLKFIKKIYTYKIC